MLFFGVVAYPYLSDMLGSKGLIRLSQESSMHEFGDVLVITENRQMCYIASGYNQKVAKLCYALWNKPGEKLVNIAKIYVQLLSPKYLFLNGYQKDVVPESSGAFLEVLVPFYLLGLYYLITNLSKKKEYPYIIISWLVVTIPIAVAGAQNIHRNVIGLYFVFLISIYGIYAAYSMLIKLRSKSLKYALIVLFALTYLWSQTRYLANYYFIYTRVQPEIWLTDTPEIMQWLGDNHKGRVINYYDYDFAPLFYSFYNHLDPSYFQKNSTWSDLNQYGWTHLNQIGNIMQNHDNIWVPICAHSITNEPSRLLVVTGTKTQWRSLVEKQFKNFTGIHVLHEVYDSKILYDYLFLNNPKTLRDQCSILQKK
jgi:hypothetical protein